VGQKTNPVGFRLGITQNWTSVWFASQKYREFLEEDIKIRRYLNTRRYLNIRQGYKMEVNKGGADDRGTGYKEALLSRIEIHRLPQHIRITLHSARPGVIIGKKGQNVEYLKYELEKLTGKKVNIDINEIRFEQLDPVLIALDIAKKLEERQSYKRAMKRAVGNAIRAGAKGIKIRLAGRLNGAEMRRRDEEKQGRIPLHTLRADINFAMITAHTNAGCIGVKVWIYNGEIFDFKERF